MKINQTVPRHFWEGFLGDTQFREKTTSSRIVAILESLGVRSGQGARVIDMAGGTGLDSIYLARQGYAVTCNELDPDLMTVARENISKSGLSVAFTAFDWRNIPLEYDQAFDAVLCTGNSLSYLFEERDRKTSVHNFSRLARKGGVVIIDQRNYDYMLDNKAHILQDPERNFHFSGNFYYCGDRVKGWPVLITDQMIQLEYSYRTLGEQIEIHLYPLRKKELTSLMQEAHLTVSVLCDFAPCSSRKSQECLCDFFQQIGIKN